MSTTPAEVGPVHGAGGQPGPGHPAAQLIDRIAESVMATPGVVGLEPTLSNALHHLVAQATPTIVTAGLAVARVAVEGISLRQTPSRTDVGVELVVSTERPARSTAEDVQRRVRSILDRAGLAGDVVVTVLSIRRATM